MNKELFLKKLDQNLKLLSKEKKAEILKKYENMDTTNLDPIIIVQNTYQELNIPYNIKFMESLSVLIDKLKSKDTSFKTILFFGYILLVIIFIKVPFIYVRDLILNLFNNIFTNATIYSLWNLLFEGIYAISAILIIIRLIKNKAMRLKYEETI